MGDKVVLQFIHNDVQLIRLPIGTRGIDPGRLIPCGPGWERKVDRELAEMVCKSRPDWFKIKELADAGAG